MEDLQEEAKGHLAPGSLLSRFRLGDWLFVVFAAVLAVMLLVQAADEDRWSDWAFGESQVMLGLRQWQENGWIANRLLLLPSGYAKPIRHLDDPELRQHGHGTAPGSSPRVGPRLWYTHYPAGYMVPFAVLFKLGLDETAYLRAMAILQSVGALALLYLLFSRIAGPLAALAAAIVYSLSPMFLGFADAVANQPTDDLLRFGFLLAVVLTTRALTPARRRTALIAAWALEFLLSLCSYDSVFFLYLWLVGWDFIEAQGFRWKKYLIFAIGPVTAFGLQFLQNVWYLGWHDAAIDLGDAFFLKTPGNTTDLMGGRITAVVKAITRTFQFLYPHPWILASAAVVFTVGFFMLREEREKDTLTVKALALLLVCGLAFGIVLPHTMWMPYEGRQMAPFLALLVGGLAAVCIRQAAALVAVARGGAGETPGRPSVPVRLIYLLFAGAILGIFTFFAAKDLGAYRRSPSRSSLPAGHPDVRLAKALKVMPTVADPIFFDLGGFSAYWNPNHMPGYPQIHPSLEYYAGSRPILAFWSADLLVADLEALIRKAPREFSPVLVSQDIDWLKSIAEQLWEKGLLRSMPQGAVSVEERWILDLTDHLR